MAAAAITAAAVIGLTGCGMVEGLVQDAAREAGVDVEFSDGGVTIDGDTFGAEIGTGGEPCMPGYVTIPEGDVLFGQALRAADGGSDVEVCVNAFDVPGAVDVGQSLPYVGDGEELGGFADMMIALLGAQIGGADGGLLSGLVTGQVDDVRQQLEAEGLELEVYGDGDRILIVVESPPLDGQHQVSMGLACNGSC